MRRATTTLAVIAGLSLLACQPADQGQQAGTEADEAGEGEVARGVAGDEAPDGHSVSLAEKNDSGLAGSVRIELAGDSLSATVEASGLAAGESYPLHIHEGSCDAGGPVAVGLNPLEAEAGTGSESRSTVAVTDLEGASSHYVQAHLPDGTPALCGDLPALPEISGGAESSGAPAGNSGGESAGTG